ncbi:MAG: hypothetical protein E5W81_13070 [Mesorhizobium sp.]|nr:MAG: hypothetical protein E5V36_09515 [Mesorhizobium sp.]TKB80860.1 MAG: hypothetical protein E5W81_13070 [Mesorhizobium sp.]
MSNPWDPYPFPLFADQSDSVLYEAIGRTLDRWEWVEFELARMYSLFVGDPEWSKMQEYGSGNIFRDRLSVLSQAAANWFRKHPCQSAEGEYNSLVIQAKGFADRRNEVAHGMVMDVKDFLFWKDKLKLAAPNVPQILLVPPYYLLRKHDNLGLPGFGYSSVELQALMMRLFRLTDAINGFNLRVWPIESR